VSRTVVVASAVMPPPPSAAYKVSNGCFPPRGSQHADAGDVARPRGGRGQPAPPGTGPTGYAWSRRPERSAAPEHLAVNADAGAVGCVSTSGRASYSLTRPRCEAVRTLQRGGHGYVTSTTRSRDSRSAADPPS
jgi:hypothetical protein